MAESVVKIRIDSQEYDAKLKKAGDALNRYFDVVRKGGGTLEVLDEGVLDAVKAMGQMETASNSAKGKVGELTKAFTELHVQYQQLTDEEKSSPIGQEMSKSLDQLKQRLSESKTQLNNATSAINNLDNSSSQASSILDQLASKFVINIDALKLFNIGLSAAKKALDVVKDAFFSSEANIDEWGRTVKGAEGAYDIFLQTLNGGDWTNFFTNLSEAVRGARDLYDAFDRLGSIKNNNQAAIAILEQKLSQLRLLQQAGENVSKEIESTTKQLSALKGQSVEAGKNLGTQGAANIIRNSVNANGGRSIVSDNTINAVVNEIMNVGQRAIDKYAQNYSILRKRGTRYVEQRDENGEVYTTVPVFDLKSLSVRDQWNYLISNAVKQRETSLAPYIGYYARAVNEETSTNRQEYRYNRYALQGTGGSGGGSGTSIIKTEEQLNSEQIQNLTQEYIAATDDRRQAIREEIKVLQERNLEIQKLKDEASGKIVRMTVDLPDYAQIGQQLSSQFSINNASSVLNTTLGIGNVNELRALQDNLARLTEAQKEFGGVSSEVWQAFQDQIESVQGQIDTFKGNGQKGKARTEEVKLNEVLGGLSGGMSQMVSGIEQLGIEVPNELKSVVSGIQAVSSILTGISAILTVIEAVTSADAFIPFSRGGVVKHAASGWRVPGNNYSDNVPALLTSGELVLNRAQQGNLSSIIEGNMMGNLNLTATISGEQIRLALNNASRRRGRGEYVTSKTIR